METANEWLNETDLSISLTEMITMAQNEAYNEGKSEVRREAVHETVKACADNAEWKWEETVRPDGTINSRPVIDRESILKVESMLNK